MKKAKQVGYLSIIIFVISSTIGAGIFFKNQELNQLAHGNLWLVISVWIVAAFGIIAMALALIEISSAQKTNQGFLEWLKIFTNKWITRSSINYFKYFYNTLNMFAMPLYAVMSLQDAGWELPDGWGILVVAYVIFAFFNIMNLLSFNVSAWTQRLLGFVKFIPLIVLPILAFVNTGNFDNDSTIIQKSVSLQPGINSVSPFIILIAGLPAIAFAFDGFYTVSSLQEQVSDQKKMGLFVAIGLLIITATYLFLTIGFNLGSSSGTYGGIHPWFMSPETWDIILKVANLLIALAIFGIINGYAMSSPKQYVSLAQSGESNDILWLQLWIFRNKTDKNSKKQLFFVSWLFFFFSSSLIYLIFGLLGYYAFVGLDPGDYASSYGIISAQIYNLTDILVNYTSMIIFFVIATAILGGIINRWTKKIAVKKFPGFFFFASVSVFMMYASTIYSLVSAAVNSTGYLGADQNIDGIKLGIFLAFMILPSLRPVIAYLFEKRTKREMKWFKFRTPNDLDYHFKRMCCCQKISPCQILADDSSCLCNQKNSKINQDVLKLVKATPAKTS